MHIIIKILQIQLNAKQKQKPGNYISIQNSIQKRSTTGATGLFLPHILEKKEKVLLITFTAVSQKATTASQHDLKTEAYMQ